MQFPNCLRGTLLAPPAYRSCSPACIHRLISEVLVEVDVAGSPILNRFSSVPLDCTQKIQICRWQRATVKRRLCWRCLGTGIRILNAGDPELSGARDGQRDTNQAFAEQ